MKIIALATSKFAVALLAAAFLATAIAAQAPQGPPPPQGAGGPGGRQQQPAPPPTNLKVLPKDLTGDQVRDIMRGWQAQTGLTCGDCHYTDPAKIGPNGRPQTDYPADKKPEKEIARIMYTMTEDMKHNYISKVAALDPHPEDASELTCGTCHRGKAHPEQFVPQPRQGGPGGPQGAPQGGPQGAAPTPMGR